jgi:hypothetical protein
MSTLLYYSVKIMALTDALEDVIKQTARADELDRLDESLALAGQGEREREIHIHMHVYTGIQSNS